MGLYQSKRSVDDTVPPVEISRESSNRNSPEEEFQPDPSSKSSVENDLPPISISRNGILQINDSVWELYSPSAGHPNVEIIFFHGLQQSDYQEAFWSTWVDRSESVIWPKDWLSRSFPKARILAISYLSSAPMTWGQVDPHILFENLMYDIIEVAGVGQNCNVVLVGHSLGGDIIKGLLVECYSKSKSLISQSPSYTIQANRIDNFCQRCKGLFFYSVAHASSKVLGDYMDTQLYKRLNPGPTSTSLVLLLKILNKDISRINDAYQMRRLAIRSFSVIESTLRVKQVHEDEFYVADADHFQTCKPTSPSDPIYTKLVEFVEQVSIESMEVVT